MDASRQPNYNAPPPGIGIAGAALLTLMVGAARLVPHPWNITPVDGLCLFLGARQRSVWAFLLPVVMRLATDALLMTWLRATGYVLPWDQMAILFGLIGLSALLGVAIGRLVQRSRSPLLLAGAGTLGVAQFFLISNFGSWLVGGYPRTVAGLLECYAAGLPFLGNTVAAGLGGFFLFLGLHALYLRVAPAANLQPACDDVPG